MEIRNRIVLVTGANRGIGRALVDCLVAAGVSKVYAGARRPELVRRAARVVPVHIDLLQSQTVLEASRRCHEVTVLINNAGIMRGEPLLRPTDLDAAHEEMQVNFFGTLRMLRAFAPVLGLAAESVVVNVLSIAARVSAPRIGSYCASKAAALSLTQAARAELEGQGTRVIAVLPGFVDTDMAKQVTLPKLSPKVVAAQIIAAIRGNTEDLYPGPASEVAARLLSEPKVVEREFARLFARPPSR